MIVRDIVVETEIRRIFPTHLICSFDLSKNQSTKLKSKDEDWGDKYIHCNKPRERVHILNYFSGYLREFAILKSLMSLSTSSCTLAKLQPINKETPFNSFQSLQTRKWYNKLKLNWKKRLIGLPVVPFF